MASAKERRASELPRWLALLIGGTFLALGLSLAWPYLGAALGDAWVPIDHRIYHCAVRAVGEGMDPYLGLYPAGCEELRFRYVYPPAVLALFRWLSPGELGAASLLLSTLQAIAFVVIAFKSARLFFPGLRPGVALPLYFLSAPTALINWLYFGNVVIILYALVLAGAVCLVQPRPRLWPFMLALAVAAAFKWILLSLALVLPFLFGRRGLMAAIGLGAAMALLYALDYWRAPEAFAAYAANFDIHRQLVDLGGGVATLAFDLLELVGGERDLSDTAEWLARGLWALYAVLVLALSLLALRRLDGVEAAAGRLQRLALGLLLGVILLPRLKDYDLYLLMPSLLFLLAASRPGIALPSVFLLPLKAAVLSCWAVVPYHTAVAIVALGLPFWLVAVWRGWLILVLPQPRNALPTCLHPLLLRSSATRSP